MKKIFFLFFLLLFGAGSLRAQGIRFLQNKTWAQVKAQALRENKMIFLDAYAVWCGPCRYLQQEVFTDPAVAAFYNQHYLNVKMDMEKGEGPALSEALGLTAYPTLFFFSPQGKLVHKVVGAAAATEFLDLGKKTLDPANQFYTQKTLAQAGKLSPKQMHTWIHVANEMEDEDTENIIMSYLTQKSDYLADKELAMILLDHTTKLTRSQLTSLQAKTAQLAQLTGKSEAETRQKLADKLEL